MRGLRVLVAAQGRAKPPPGVAVVRVCVSISGRDGSGAGRVSRQGVKEPGLGDRLGCSLVLQPEREVWGWLE